MITEATQIIKSNNTNQSKGSCQLSHIWDKLLNDIRKLQSVLKTSAERSKCQ